MKKRIEISFTLIIALIVVVVLSVYALLSISSSSGISVLMYASNATSALENVKLTVQIVYYVIGITIGILTIFGVTLYKRSRKEVPYIRKIGTIIKKRVSSAL